MDGGNRKRTLRLAFWNADGLHRNRAELRSFAEEYDVDVLLIGETHLRSGDNPKLANYHLYRTDRRGARGGGTAVYVRRQLDHSELPLPELEHLEATVVIASVPDLGKLRIVAGYNPPGPDRSLLAADLDAVLDGDDPVILAGDLNAKHRSWNSRVANANGRTLFNYAQQRCVAVDGPPVPTHYPTVGNPDVLDVAVFKNVPWVHHLRTASALSSDHEPVLLDLARLDGGAVGPLSGPAKLIV